MYIPISLAKKHLNIDQEFKDDDAYIIKIIAAAEDAISKRIDRDLCECVNHKTGYLEQSIQQSILLLIGQFYKEREATTSQSANEIPIGFNFICDLNKHYNIP